MLFIVVLCSILPLAAGHGRLISPPGRSTMWRYGYQTVHNSNDHQLSCGGFGVQFYRNDGKCGICGDRYDGPRDNEAGGKYATGTITGTYKQGDAIEVKVEITVNHGGWFEFRLCPNNDYKRKATQECLDRYLLKQANGDTKYHMPTGLGTMAVTLQLPQDLTCSQCVLQWKWNTASNVRCNASRCCRGCGPQEQFYGCADVSITQATDGPKVPQILPTHTDNGTPLVPPSSNNNYTNFNNNNYNNKVTDVLPVHTDNGTPLIPASINNNNNNYNNYNNNVPGAFLPISPGAGGSFIPISPEPFKPVDPTSECKATSTFRMFNPVADAWCVTSCANPQGFCPGTRCTEACRPAFSQSPGCTATPYWREKFADADNWCKQRCQVGLCPLEYCNKTCLR